MSNVAATHHSDDAAAANAAKVAQRMSIVLGEGRRPTPAMAMRACRAGRSGVRLFRRCRAWRNRCHQTRAVAYGAPDRRADQWHQGPDANHAFRSEPKTGWSSPTVRCGRGMHLIRNALAAAAEAAGASVAQIFLAVRASGSGNCGEGRDRQNDRQHDLVHLGHSPLLFFACLDSHADKAGLCRLPACVSRAGSRDGEVGH